MLKGILISVGVILLILILFILYDKRKAIFKKREKKEKKEPVEVKKEEVSAVEEEVKKDPKVSFEKREPVKKEVSEPVIEDLDIDTDQRQEYTPTPSSFSRMPTKRPMPQLQHNFFRPRRRSIKEQIDDLSPEMKAILFSNALGKKEDLF